MNLIARNLVFNCGEFLTRDRGIQDLMDNRLTARDPGFVDAARGNFQLKPTAPAPIGFQPIPFEEIGPYQDGLPPPPKAFP